MNDYLPDDFVEKVLNGMDFIIPKTLSIAWSNSRRLSVSSRYGGFTRTVNEINRPSVKTHLEKIVKAYNEDVTKQRAALENPETPAE